MFTGYTVGWMTEDLTCKVSGPVCPSSSATTDLLPVGSPTKIHGNIDGPFSAFCGWTRIKRWALSGCVGYPGRRVAAERASDIDRESLAATHPRCPAIRFEALRRHFVGS